MKTVKIAVIGKGRVGKALIGMLGARHDVIHTSGLQLEVVCIAGRHDAILAKDGGAILPAHLRAFADGIDITDDYGRFNVRFANMLASMPLFHELVAQAATAEQRMVVVDATDYEYGAYYDDALRNGWGVVTGNKGPFANPVQHRVIVAAVGTQYRFRYEATVGAGLPIISTIQELRERGEQVLQIRAAPSGTIGYLITEFQRGVPVPQGLAEAQRLGYAESDPSADMSGLDVRRKAEILVHTSGWDAQVHRYEVMPFEPLQLRHESVPYRPGDPGENVDLPPLVYRYIAEMTPTATTIGLQRVPSSDPFAALAGTDNLFVIRTNRQTIEIKGPGAGPEVTAGAMFSDILKVARSL
jgi:homoserine dehydrogenase